MPLAGRCRRRSSRQFYLGDQFGLYPVPVRLAPGRALAAERTAIGFEGNELLEQASSVALVEAGADAARMD